MQSQPHISEIIAINALAQFGDRNEMDWRWLFDCCDCHDRWSNNDNNEHKLAVNNC